MGLAASLLVAASSLRPLRAAEQLQVQLDGMVIPLQIDDLVAWGRSGGVSNSELGIWLNLLEPDSREGVLELLRAPLINDRSMARQLLGSWAGRRLLDEVADIVRVDDDSAGDTLLNTLESLLNRQEQVSSLDLLEALPASHVRLDLDALLQAAGHWRQQLQRQQQLVRRLAGEARDQATASPPPAVSGAALGAREPEIQLLPVDHRAHPLRLQLWRPQPGAPAHSTWLVWMPGLGGSPDHFRWLGRALSRRGWSVLVLEHPGSDAEAVKALLAGRRPPPGAEVIPDRLRDLEAVLAARRSGTIALPGEQLVLGGHSLGALTALLGAGARPRSGLDRRCTTALNDLPLGNLSRLLQCQLAEVALPPSAERTEPADLVGLIGMNSFGSLLWPRNRPLQLPVPVLFSGGSLDLITPPQSEQLGLMLALAPHPASRAVVVDGASHFSPVRVEGQAGEGQGEDLFRLGKELVGVQPLQVQALLADEIVAFLALLEGSSPEEVAAQTSTLHRRIGDLQLHRLNREAVSRLLAH
jgi:predicted dienelactone hydrolase